jgi:hypothetical protein
MRPNVIAAGLFIFRLALPPMRWLRQALAA